MKFLVQSLRLSIFQLLRQGNRVHVEILCGELGVLFVKFVNDRRACMVRLVFDPCCGVHVSCAAILLLRRRRGRRGSVGLREQRRTRRAVATFS